MADAHETHDLALIVAFSDGEVDADERVTAEAQVATCTDCAVLVADLRALSAADRALATPPRAREFRLSAADAARLATPTAEPVATATRLGRDMTPANDHHPTHDPELIAAVADGGLTGSDLARAQEWLATCSACADLRDDLVAIAAANRALPTPARSRDYVLTAADADRLRAGGWRGLLVRIGSSRDAVSRPLAMGLTTFGLAGLLLAGGSSFLSGAASTAGAPLSTVGESVDGGGVFSGAAESAASLAPTRAEALASEAPAAASAAPSGAQAVPETLGEVPADGGGDAAAGSEDSPAASPVANAQTDSLRMSADDQTAGTGGPSPLLTLSVLMLVGGLGLFAIRWTARRLRGA